VRYGDVGRYKNIDGQIFGVYKIIGFTGETDEYNRQLCLARNLENGELVIAPKIQFTKGDLTGYTNSTHHIYLASKLREKLNFEQEKKRKIKAKIARYKKSKGVSFRKNRNKWVATIRINKKIKYLGHFTTEQEAKAARQKAVDEQIKILEKQLEEL